MTSPESASPSRPAKAAGFALLGVAAVALVIGVVSLFGGSSDDPPSAGSTTAPPPTTTAPPASDPSTAPPAATTTTPPPASSAPPTSSAAVPPPPVTKPGSVKVPVRVYNNSTISGLASRASDDVRNSGWTVAETGNYAGGTIPTTTVYFRPGTDEEASAKELAAVLRARVEPRFEGIKQSAAGVILIVTNDYQGAVRNK